MILNFRYQPGRMFKFESTRHRFYRDALIQGKVFRALYRTDVIYINHSLIAKVCKAKMWHTIKRRFEKGEILWLV